MKHPWGLLCEVQKWHQLSVYIGRKLCDTTDCSLPVSSVHRILQARILDWSPFPSPGDRPHPGIELRSPWAQLTLQAKSSPCEPPGKPRKLTEKVLLRASDISLNIFLIIFSLEFAHSTFFLNSLGSTFCTVAHVMGFVTKIYSKEIKSIYPKENQSWISLAGLMLKLQNWPPDVKNWLIGKDTDAGND